MAVISAWRRVQLTNIAVPPPGLQNVGQSHLASGRVDVNNFTKISEKIQNQKRNEKKVKKKRRTQRKFVKNRVNENEFEQNRNRDPDRDGAESNSVPILPGQQTKEPWATEFVVHFSSNILIYFWIFFILISSPLEAKIVM